MVKRHRFSGKKKLILGFLVIVLVAAGGLLYHQHQKKNLNLAASKKQSPVKGTTSKPTPHQVPTTPNNNRQGGVIDKSGQTTSALPPSSQWVSSSSGNITLQLPSPNSIVRSGDTISGLAKVSGIQFILKDDAVGVISQGNLSVVNGKFAGTMQFTPHSNTGKLEVYYPDPSNGAEQDIIEIDVSFST